MTKRIFTPEEVIEARAMAASGASLAKIAREFGTSPEIVRRESGVKSKPRSGRPRTFSEIEASVAKRLSEDGASMLEIAKTLNSSPKTIRRHFPFVKPWTREESMAFAIAMSPLKNRAPQLPASRIIMMRKMFSEGKSINEIRRATGAGHDTIRRWTNGVDRA